MGLGELQPGTLFAHDFRIVRLLSTGGMGAVYVAEQLSTSKERALKLMRPELVSNADLRRRFEQEAKVSAKIASDHVVEIVGAGIDEASGTPWLAMELLDGEDLEARIARDGALDQATVREMFEQLCHALQAAHARKIVHRDMKPENIFLAAPRRPGVPFTVKILDFGIAKTLADAEANVTASIGTPLWMAPEQTTQGAAIAPAADVWALGLIAFRLLSGRLYWKAAYDGGRSTAMLLREVLIDPMVPASARAAEYGVPPLPEGFDEWFARATTREPGERFPEAGALYRELAPLLGGSASSLPSLRGAPTSIEPSRSGATRVSGEPPSASSGSRAATEIAFAATAYVTGPSPAAMSLAGPVSGAAQPTQLAPVPQKGFRTGAWMAAIAVAIGILFLGVFIGLRARGGPRGARVFPARRPLQIPASALPPIHRPQLPNGDRPRPSRVGEPGCPCRANDERCLTEHPMVCSSGG